MKTFLKNAVLVVVLISMTGFVMSAESEEKQGNKLEQLTKVSMVQAQKTALAKAPGKIVEAGLEIENGLLIYSFDIRVASGGITEVQVNAKDGSVVMAKAETKHEAAMEAAQDHNKMTESGEEAGEGMMEKAEGPEKRGVEEESDAEEAIVGTIHVKKHFHLKKLAKINEIAARKAALQMVEGTVKEVELENEDGFLVYNVSILFNRQEWEVLVDAGNGLVLTVDTED